MAPHILLPSSRSVSPCPALAAPAESTLVKRVTATAMATGVAALAAERIKVGAAAEETAERKGGASSFTAVARAAAEATKELPVGQEAAAKGASMCTTARRQEQHTAVTDAIPRTQEKTVVTSTQQEQLSARESRSNTQTPTETREAAAAADRHTAVTARSCKTVSSSATGRNSVPQMIVATEPSTNGCNAAPSEYCTHVASRSPVSSDATAVSAVTRCAVRATYTGANSAAAECGAAPLAAPSTSRERRRLYSTAHYRDVAGAATARSAAVRNTAAVTEAGAAAGKREADAGEREEAVREKEAAAGESKATRGKGEAPAGERELAAGDGVLVEVSSLNGYQISDDVEGEDDLMFSVDADVPSNDKFNLLPDYLDEGTATAAAGRTASPVLDRGSIPGEVERHACTRPAAVSVSAPAVEDKQAAPAGRSAYLHKNAWPSLGCDDVSRNQRKLEQQFLDSAEKIFRVKVTVTGGKIEKGRIASPKVSEIPSGCPPVTSCSTATGSTRVTGTESWSASTARVEAGGGKGQKPQGQQRQSEGGDHSAGSNNSDGAEGQFTEGTHAAPDGRVASTAARAQTATAKRRGIAFLAENDEGSARHTSGAKEQQQVKGQLKWRHQQQSQLQQQQQNHQQRRPKQQEGGRQDCRGAAAVAANSRKIAARSEGKATGAAEPRAAGPKAGGPGYVPLRTAGGECGRFPPSSLRPRAAVGAAAAVARSSDDASAAGVEDVTPATAARKREVCKSLPAAPWSRVLPSAVSSSFATTAPLTAEGARNSEAIERDSAPEGESTKMRPGTAADADAAAVPKTPAAAAAEETAVVAERKEVNVATPAASAAAADEVCAVARVVHRAPPGLAGPDLHTALLRAAFLGRTDIIAACLQRGADVSFCDSVGRSALHYAAATGAESGLKLLLDAGAARDVNKRDHKFWTPLLIAVTKTHLACTRLLLQHGAKVDMLLCHRCAPCRSTSSNTFMHKGRHSQTVSADNRDHALAVIEKLEAERKAIDIATAMKTSGEEHLAVAAVSGLDCRETAGGRRQRSQSSAGSAPCLEEPALASCSSETALLQEVKQKQQEGTRQQQEEKRGEASDEREHGKTRAATLSLGKEAGGGDARVSEDPGAEALHHGEAGPAQTWSSAIHFAAIKGNVEISRLLLSYGATVNDLDSDARPPLHYAACRDNTLYVKWLLDQGACVDLLDVNKRSALHAAALKGQLQNAETLLGAATDHATAFFLLKKKDVWDISPAQLAQLHGHNGLQLLLESYTEEMEERIGTKEAARLLQQQQQLPGTSSSELTQLNTTIVEVLATGLREEKRSKLERAVGRLGTMICLTAYHKTMLIQENDAEQTCLDRLSKKECVGCWCLLRFNKRSRNMLIPICAHHTLRGRLVADGSRKKTAGGVFFDLLKEMSRNGEFPREDLIYIEMEDGEARRAQRRRAQQLLLQQQQHQQRRGDGISAAETADGCGGLTHAAAQPKKQQQYEHQLLQALPFAGFPPVASLSPRARAAASADAVYTSQASRSAVAASGAPVAVSDTSHTSRRDTCQRKPQQQQPRQISSYRPATSGSRHATPATGHRRRGRGRGTRGPGGQEVQQRNTAVLQRRPRTDGNPPATRATVAIAQRRATATPWSGCGDAATPAEAASALPCAQHQVLLPGKVTDRAAAATAAGAASAAAAAVMYPFQMYPLMPLWPLSLPFSIPFGAGAAANPAAAAAHSAAAARVQQLPLSCAALPTSNSSGLRAAAAAGRFSTSGATALPMPFTSSCLAGGSQPGAAVSAEIGNVAPFPSVVDPSLPLAFASAAVPPMQQLLLQQQLFQAAAVWGTDRAASGAVNDQRSSTWTLLNEDRTHEHQQDNRCGSTIDISTQLEKQQHKRQKPQPHPQQQLRWRRDFAAGAKMAAKSTAAVTVQEKEASGGHPSSGIDGKNFPPLDQNTGGGTSRSGSYRSTAAPRGEQMGGRGIGAGGGHRNFRRIASRRPSATRQTAV